MEIIIRMEEKENPTVGAALREMAEDAWVQTWLPKLVESAKMGYTVRTERFSTTRFSSNTIKMVKEAFEKIGISVDCRRWDYKGEWELTFSWA